MTEILLPYGLRDGSLVHISSPDIFSGLTNCVCPECHETLIARKGEINQHHFAHKGEAGDPLYAGCMGGFETAAHLRAKEIIAEAGEIMFPDNKMVRLDSVLLEKRLDPHALQPDITVKFGETTAVIEIYITNRCSAAKRELLQSRLIPSMEIVLQKWRHEVTNDEEYREAVLRKASRVWIYDPSAKDRRSAYVVLQDARREAAAKAEFLAGLPAAHAERLREGGVYRTADEPSPQPKPKQPTTLSYEARKCAYEGCGENPSFGYGPPFCKQQTWVCREHIAWFEAQHEKPAAQDIPPDAWVEQVMEATRRQYAEITQPQVRAAAEAHRANRSRRNA